MQLRTMYEPTRPAILMTDRCNCNFPNRQLSSMKLIIHWCACHECSCVLLPCDWCVFQSIMTTEHIISDMIVPGTLPHVV